MIKLIKKMFHFFRKKKLDRLFQCGGYNFGCQLMFEDESGKLFDSWVRFHGKKWKFSSLKEVSNFISFAALVSRNLKRTNMYKDLFLPDIEEL